MITSHPIRLNGKDLAVRAESTLLELITEVTGHALRADGSRDDGGKLGIAAAVGGVVVPRSQWDARTLRPGEEVEVVTAVQGG